MSLQFHYEPRPRLVPVHHAVRLFTLHFDNKKRQMQGYHAYEAEGTRYSDGRVHVNTMHFPQRDFDTLHEMEEAFGEYGTCEISWLDEKRG